MTRRYRLTELAEEDIFGILRETARRFGPVQRRRYGQIIAGGTALVADQPERPGSRPRPELGEGVRSFHLELSAGRLGAASHLLYYIRTEHCVVILRVLHERMEPFQHLPES